MDDKFHDQCAIIGVIGHPEASNFCYLGLYALQHRGQEGAGIVSTDGKHMYVHRDMGLVSEVFDAERLSELRGEMACGHNRYATCGSKDRQNLQPFVANFGEYSFAIAHNGNLVNAEELREELQQGGAIFSSTSDTEAILHLIARASGKESIAGRIAQALQQVKGAYSLVVMGNDSLIAVRDPFGVRPLSLGKIGNGYVVASETCAFDLIGATFVREIKPGEILVITKDGTMLSDHSLASTRSSFCVFEYIYFSRPDSVIDGRSVYSVRKRLGVELAKEHPADVDVVIPVPDSGVPAAIGYAQQLGLPMEYGLIRNHYIGRTFIEPKQAIRDFGVKIKLNPNREVLAGKRVAVVDDSIVRGTTSQKIVKMLRDSGATEIHFRISSPPTTGPCHYGIDTPSKEELIASSHSVKEIEQYIAVESLAYLSIAGLYRAVGAERTKFCDACFSGEYLLGLPQSKGKSEGTPHQVRSTGSSKSKNRENTLVTLLNS